MKYTVQKRIERNTQYGGLTIYLPIGAPELTELPASVNLVSIDRRGLIELDPREAEELLATGAIAGPTCEDTCSRPVKKTSTFIRLLKKAHLLL